jgi:protocatechuate 3,4-dioxygenase beta subunit
MKPTPSAEEGPYYKEGSPERKTIRQEGVPGQKLTLSGVVKDAQDRPIAHAWMDFWQANGRGIYDNEGYTLRGHQYTDREGKYTLETVTPAGYSMRTPHIHAKVRARDNSPVLTVQLFFPGVPSNKDDFIYRDDLQMQVKEAPAGKQATFDFVLED